LLFTPAIARIQRYSQLLACSNSMRKHGESLINYSDLHDGSFPNPGAENEPCNVAGFELPIMVEAGVAEDADSLRCPGGATPVALNWTTDELRAMKDEEFRRRCAPYLLGSYAYSLGYRADDRLVGLDRDNGFMPILADRPPNDPAGRGYRQNSPNHYGTGQNVLFTDGHVEFITTRTRDDDDLFLNRKGKPEPGVGRNDTVLGPSATPVK
jgi:prepilin-type processing-associated H-X9-DG protein